MRKFGIDIFTIANAKVPAVMARANTSSRGEVALARGKGVITGKPAEVFR